MHEMQSSAVPAYSNEPSTMDQWAEPVSTSTITNEHAFEAHLSEQIQKAKAHIDQQPSEAQQELAALREQIKSMEPKFAPRADQDHPPPERQQVVPTSSPSPSILQQPDVGDGGLTSWPKTTMKGTERAKESRPKLPSPKIPISTYQGKSWGEYSIFLNRLNSYFQAFPSMFTTEHAKVDAAVTFFSDRIRDEWTSSKLGYTWPSFRNFCQNVVGEKWKGIRRLPKAPRTSPSPAPSEDKASSSGRWDRPPSVVLDNNNSLSSRSDDVDEEECPPNPTVIGTFQGTWYGESEIFIGQLKEFFRQHPRYFAPEKRMIATCVDLLSPGKRHEWLQQTDGWPSTWKELKEFCRVKSKNAGNPGWSDPNGELGKAEAVWRYSHSFQRSNQTVTSFAKYLCTTERSLPFIYSEDQRKAHLKSKLMPSIYSEAAKGKNLFRDYDDLVQHLQAIEDSLPSRRDELAVYGSWAVRERYRPKGPVKAQQTRDGREELPPSHRPNWAKAAQQQRAEEETRIDSKKRPYVSSYDDSNASTAAAVPSPKREEESSRYHHPKRKRPAVGQQVTSKDSSAPWPWARSVRRHEEINHHHRPWPNQRVATNGCPYYNGHHSNREAQLDGLRQKLLRDTTPTS